jgi:hypothetical protein
MSNAFNWRTGAPSVATPAKTLPARAQDLNSNGSIYTHAPAGKTPYGRTKPFVNHNAKI